MVDESNKSECERETSIQHIYIYISIVARLYTLVQLNVVALERKRGRVSAHVAFQLTSERNGVRVWCRCRWC